MRKSKLYLVLSFLCIVDLFVICFITKLPNTIPFNIIRILLILLGITLYTMHDFYKKNEYISKAYRDIEKLRKEYSYIADIVDKCTDIAYSKISKEDIQKYLIILDLDDDYLLDFEANISAFKAKENTDKINNEFISICCVMDSLVSAWKIRSAIPNKIITFDNLVSINSEIAVSVALSLCNLSYEKLKNDARVEKLIKLLNLCFLDSQYGLTTSIEYEAMILELLYNEFSQEKSN